MRSLLTETPETVEVILFKPSGKYYTVEPWRVPVNAIGPYDMIRSPDFRRISGGHVLIEAQEPWGYPHLFPGQLDPVAMTHHQQARELADRAQMLLDSRSPSPQP